MAVGWQVSSDGRELAVRVRARGPTKVLVVTGAGYAGGREGGGYDGLGGAGGGLGSGTAAAGAFVLNMKR